MQISAFSNSMASGSSASGNEDKLKAACREFEAILLQRLFKSMDATVPEGGLLPKSPSREIFTDFHHQQMSLRMAGSQSVGIADAIYRQIAKSP